jgi:hypothetical protein
MEFFIKNNFINHKTHNVETNKILLQLYKDIYTAYIKLNNLKKLPFYTITIKRINNINDISKPKYFKSDSIPLDIRNHIDNISLYEISYTFFIINRTITIHFIIEHDNPSSQLNKYNEYVEWIVIWLNILNIYASKTCSKSLIIYLYFTSLEKHLPSSNIEILDQHNVNTAFTSTCPVFSEIIIYRKEEWFKVFIHETFHNFGLDFSDMNTSECNKKILSIFKVNSSVNLYESYTEVWATILNSLFCSFFLLKNKKNYTLFLSQAEFLINFEKTYSFFQLIKILNFMGLNYSDLYSEDQTSISLRNTLYKEKTNVLAYYIIKLILLNDYPSFLKWCKSHNLSLLAFQKTKKNQLEFCDFIHSLYLSPSMLEGIHNTNYFLKNHPSFKSKSIQNQTTSKSTLKLNTKSSTTYLLSNLRMTIWEMS